MTFSQKVIEDVLRSYHERGYEGPQQVSREKLDEWKSLPMNIAVIGQPVSGKSSLINALTGKRRGDDGYAPVGCNETTRNIRQYTHPDNDKLVLTNVPGVGTMRFLQATYMEDIKVDTYDFFLLLASKQFLEEDVWLAQELTKRRKGFFLVRTHTELSVINGMRDTGLSETEVINRIRAFTLGQRNQYLRDDKLFLVDNYETQKYDFKALNNKMIGDFPELLQEALLLTMRSGGNMARTTMKHS